MAEATNYIPGPENNKERIAKVVTFTVLGLTALILVGAVIVILSEKESDKKFEHFKDTIVVLLPLWGTWIGTVLAYYFSKDNFESANRSVRQIVDKLTSQQKLESVKAADVMIKKDKLIYKTIAAGGTLADFKLKEDCIEFTETNKIKRVILLDEQGRAKYVIHRDLIAYFLATAALNADEENPVQITTLTLQDMVDKGSPDTKEVLANSVKFISENANLLDAKNIMEQFRTCQDVFITRSGTADEPVLGWVTNVTISENSIL